MRYTHAQTDRLAANPKRLFNELHLVTDLSPQVVGLQERGFSLAAIAAHLTADGFQIGEATLRIYLARTKNRGRWRRRGRPGARATTRAGKRYGAEVLN